MCGGIIGMPMGSYPPHPCTQRHVPSARKQPTARLLVGRPGQPRTIAPRYMCGSGAA
jgi:hypothetical protein